MMKMAKTRKYPKYLSPRGYRHFDLPPNRARILSKVSTPGAVAAHGFLPLLSFEKRRWRRDKSTCRRVPKAPRVIAFAAHMDAAIFGFYAERLQTWHEAELQRRGLGAAVVGYRSGLGANYHIASRAFDFVRARPASVALCLDVRDFFGSIDHGLLLDAWHTANGGARLDADAFAVYRAATRYASVDRDELGVRLGYGRRRMGAKVRRKRGSGGGRGRRGRPAPRRICDAATLRRLRAADDRSELVRVNTTGKGIPQGLPISAALSNLYMLGFDEAVLAAVSIAGGLYLRYSDDILVVCPKAALPQVEAVVNAEIRKVRLTFDEGDKRQVVDFGNRDESGRVAGDRDGRNRMLQYLGLEFDGISVRIRTSSLQRFRTRLERTTRRYREQAELAGAGPGEVRGKAIYRRFSDSRGWDSVRDDEVRNFSTYAERVAKATSDDTARRQVASAKRRIRELLGG